jgi:hypothetical protein
MPILTVTTEQQRLSRRRTYQQLILGKIPLVLSCLPR